MAGDTIHALRSHLDHLIWFRSGADPNDRRSQFPVCTTPKDWKKESARVKNLPDDARRLVHYLQPFRRAHQDGYALTAIAELDNMDKHRTIPVVLSTLEQTDLPFVPSIDTQVEIGFSAGPLDLSPPGPFVLGRIALDPPDPHFKVKGEFALGLAFGDSAPPDVRFLDPIQVLTTATMCVSRVSALFDRLDERARRDAHP